MNWALTILALICYSLLGLTLKSAAVRKNDPGRLIWVALIVVSVASLGAFLLGSQRDWGWQGIALGLASGVFFYLASVERVKALQSTPAGVVFAVTNLDLVISSVLAALLPFLADTLNLQKIVAAALAAAAIFLVSWSRDHRQQGTVSPHTYVSLTLLVISAMGYTIYSARLEYSVFLFMFFDHLAGVLLNARDVRNVKQVEIGWGVAAGALMFVGLWSLMTALQTSIISLTLITVSLNTVTVALLSWLFLKERLTVYQVVALFVAVAASIVVVLG
jgi:drug/metabolite transporter (DMT)-like permease